MVVNQDHVQSLVRQLKDAGPADLQTAATEYDEYIAAGRTLKDAGTGENVSVETLAEVVRVLREQADGSPIGNRDKEKNDRPMQMGGTPGGGRQGSVGETGGNKNA